MCTSILYNNGDSYFGRNLDLECHFGEKVVITPRNYEFVLRNKSTIYTKYAIIGMGNVVNEYPLYAEGANEVGLAMAGLNFPGNAVYMEYQEGKCNITPYEFVPYILGQYTNVDEVVEVLKNFSLYNEDFMDGMPLSPLHWMISDKNKSIVVEQMKDGMHVYDNHYNVMTNNPPFDYHLYNINNYMHLSASNSANRLSDGLPLRTYAAGMGAIGLPGDNSSASRFVKMVFNLANSNCPSDEDSNVAQFFHLLDSVEMVKGSVLTNDGKDDMTIYNCCINLDKGYYYYKTYDNYRINKIDMHKCDLDGDKLYIYELDYKLDIKEVN